MGQKLTVLFEDNHLLAVLKPSGILSQGDRTGDLPITELAKDYLVKKYNKSGEAYIGLPHRLDRPTSGILLLAKTSKALSRLNQMFQEHKVQKTYWAIVGNQPKQKKAHLRHYLLRNPQKNRSDAHLKEVKGSKLAELDYELILTLENYYLLEVLPKSGRHHQIRSQLSAIGCPIKGDLKYGSPRSNKGASISLHARSIVFEHPVKKEMLKINCPAPMEDTIWQICNQKFKEPNFIWL